MQKFSIYVCRFGAIAMGLISLNANAQAILVDVRSVDPTITVELRYSGKRNFLRHSLYPRGTHALARPEVASGLAAAQSFLRRYQYGLKIWDAYRPVAVQAMISAGDGESLCDFAWARAKLTEIVNTTASLHQFDALPRLKRSNQNKAVGVAFHQHVQHPVNAVIEIDVGRSRFVAFDKAARARPRKSVRGLIIDCRIRFHFDDDPRTLAPNQFSADKFARTCCSKRWSDAQA